MVKGVSKQVIVVRSPDVRYFEQAIFIVREGAFAQKGVSPERVLEEARRVADGYVRSNSRTGKILKKIPSAAWFSMGAAVTAAIWLVTLLIL